MTPYIVLLRGINVGGNKKVPMKELSQLCETLGYQAVQTYIQSGNVVLKSDESADTIKAKLAEAIEKHFGFLVDLMLRNLEEWREILAANPFPVDNPKALHSFMLEKIPEQANYYALLALEHEGEELALIGKTLFYYTPQGFGTSKLGNVIERKLKVSMTARNWNTMLKLLEMAEAIE
jgi:uncharacterized protein (DUF1697 family)